MLKSEKGKGSLSALLLLEYILAFTLMGCIIVLGLAWAIMTFQIKAHKTK